MMIEITENVEDVKYKSNIDGFGKFDKSLVYIAKVTEGFGFFELNELWKKISNQKRDQEAVSTGTKYSGFVLEISDEISPLSVQVLKAFYTIYEISRKARYGDMAIVSNTSLFETFVSGINTYNRYVNSSRSDYHLQYFSADEQEKALEWIRREESMSGVM